MISLESNNQYTIVTLLNWAHYQSREEQEVTAEEQPSNSHVTAEEQRSNTNKKDNKDKNISPTWREDFEIYRKEVKNQQINIMELILVNKKELQEMLGEIRPSNKQPESIKEEVKYLSPVEAREYMKSKGIPIAKSTLYKLTSNKKIPFTHFGKKKILFRAEELDAWVESRLKRSSDANTVTIAVAKDARSKKL